MRPIIIFVTFLVTLISLSTLVTSASIRLRDDESKQNNQYPWYYWNNNDGDQVPPYYYRQRCGAQGINSLNVFSLLTMGLVALVFAGMPDTSKTPLQRIQY